MTKKEKEVRDKVRKKLLEAKEKDFKVYSDKYWWYVSDLKDNLIGENMSDDHEKMFRNGSGGELDDKVTPAHAKAIDSSSMLSYNFFRHICEKCTVEIEEIEYNKVFFEVQIKTLSTSNSPANMDVVLVSNDGKTVLFIESKFLEYLDSGSEDFPKSSYQKEESYYDDNNETKFLHKMAKEFNNETGRYNGGIKQNICHLIGISNLKNSKKARTWFEKKYKDSPEIRQILDAKEFRFMNIIFRPKNEEALELCNKYKEDLKKFRDSLREEIKTYTKPKFLMDYRELYEILSSNLDESVKEELKKRYIDFHTDKPIQ